MTELLVERTPWEDDARGFPGNLVATWWESLTGPERFFERVDFQGPFARPLLYYLIVSIISSLFTVAWGLGGTQDATLAFLSQELGLDARGALLLSFFLSPFYALALLAVGSLVMHLFVLLLAPEHGGLGTTARVICYASGPAVLTIVPYVGVWLAWLWSLVLLVVGVRGAHRTSVGRATAVVLLPYAIGLALLVLFVLAALLILGVLMELPGA